MEIYLHTSSFFSFLNIENMKRTLIFLQFKIVNKYTDIKVNFKFIFAKFGILNLGIRSWIRIQTFLQNGSGSCSFIRGTPESSLGRYVFGSEISYNKAPPRLPGLGC